MPAVAVGSIYQLEVAGQLEARWHRPIPSRKSVVYSRTVADVESVVYSRTVADVSTYVSLF